MPDLVSTLIGGATGAASTVAGIINAAKTKKIAKELELSRPKYQISDTAGQDLDLAESELGNGMSSRAETAYNNLNNQQFSSSLSAILRGGGSTNNVAEVYGNSEDGRQRLALLNDQIRMQQIDRVMKTRSMYRDEQDKEWQINDFSPWKDKQAANAEARQNAQNQIWGGIGTVANAGMNYFGGKNREKMWDKYFKQPTSQQPGSDMPTGQQQWEDWNQQWEMDNQNQGLWELPKKYQTEVREEKRYNVPMYNTEGLYNFLNRPR